VARSKLTSDEDKGAFGFLLGAAETGIVITEDHGFWIDFRGMHQFRRAAVEAGKRFAEAGVIDSPDDVFFLLVDEVTETLDRLPDVDRRDLVAQRRASFERAQTVEAPKFVGAPPSSEEPPPNPIMLAMGKLFGGPPPASEGSELRGHPGSPGTTRGTARLITSISDADRLEPGDILVAPATAPPWTPLFAFASAVVTDSGGMLSHCAVVAREYSIPAVVGCGDATTRIADGQTIEVDGNEGVVRIVG
jgi:phosphohistidine swiveling domain-containing protein